MRTIGIFMVQIISELIKLSSEAERERENHIWKKTWMRACQAFASDQEVSVVKVEALLLLPLAPSVGVGIPPLNRLNF